MQQTELLKCDFREMVDYLSDPDNVWNPKKYVANHAVYGHSFGQES